MVQLASRLCRAGWSIAANPTPAPTRPSFTALRRGRHHHLPLQASQVLRSNRRGQLTTATSVNKDSLYALWRHRALSKCSQPGEDRPPAFITQQPPGVIPNGQPCVRPLAALERMKADRAKAGAASVLVEIPEREFLYHRPHICPDSSRAVPGPRETNKTRCRRFGACHRLDWSCWTAAKRTQPDLVGAQEQLATARAAPHTGRYRCHDDLHVAVLHR
jgi:hypothetical protein